MLTEKFVEARINRMNEGQVVPVVAGNLKPFAPNYTGGVHVFFPNDLPQHRVEELLDLLDIWTGVEPKLQLWRIQAEKLVRQALQREKPIMPEPILVFDIETTGLDTDKDEVIELGICELSNTGVKTTTLRFKPTIPISPEATAVHGITNEDVANCPTFEEAYNDGTLHALLEYTTFAGYNILNFDVPLLSNQFARLGLVWPLPHDHNIYIDVLNLYRVTHPNDLSSVYKRLTGYDLEGAHGAGADTEATASVLIQLLANNVPANADSKAIQDLAQGGKPLLDWAGKLCFNEQKQVCYNFGKNQGYPVKMFMDYALWMLKQDSFNSNTKAWIRKELAI